MAVDNHTDLIKLTPYPEEVLLLTMTSDDKNYVRKVDAKLQANGSRKRRAAAKKGKNEEELSDAMEVPQKIIENHLLAYSRRKDAVPLRREFILSVSMTCRLYTVFT